MRTLIDEVIYSKRKTLSIEVKPGGRVVMRVPKGTPNARINQFVREKSDWIIHAKARMVNIPADNTRQGFQDGEKILYLGKFWDLTHVSRAKHGLGFTPEKGFLLQKEETARASELLVKFYRQETRRLTMEIIARYAANWSLKVDSVRVTSAKTRWGSCNSKNGLNFSYRLAMLPMEMIEYVVVHELAHTRHHNHSRVYWNLVEKMMPDYRARRLWLKQNAHGLPEI